jgi:hypothetical protein
MRSISIDTLNAVVSEQEVSAELLEFQQLKAELRKSVKFEKVITYSVADLILTAPTAGRSTTDMARNAMVLAFWIGMLYGQGVNEIESLEVLVR